MCKSGDRLTIDNVRVGVLISEELKIRKETRQGCIRSPTLRATEGYGEGVLIGDRLVSNFRNADDTVLLARSQQDMANLLLRIEMISGEVGLEINRGKCQLLMTDRAHTLKENSAISWDVGVVDTYRDVLITKTEDLGERSGEGWRCDNDNSITTRTKESLGISFLSGYLCLRVMDYNIIAREENRCVRDSVERFHQYYPNYRFRKMTDFCTTELFEILRSPRATQRNRVHHTDRKDVWASHTWMSAETLRGPIKGTQ
ncbi:hypothetical protein LAZ67_10003329 [Cordylochernes scorpioides]|uniref:Reverse transcriptase domain-containing protein n=1 Tax=Cordylochernes scorpioides TaxID=51811 RepID=A0ABY6KX49_9ARAC|nr:hypothetical protein LAZ67_10003329 [Cordylochernes scorpioides]